MKAEALKTSSTQSQFEQSHVHVLLDEYSKLVAQIPGAQMPEIQRSAERFASLPADVREQTLTTFENSLLILRHLLVQNQGSQFDYQSEIKTLKALLSKKSLKLADDNFWDHLTEGDTIEVYDAKGMQLYRSWSIYQYLSYSYLDLMIYDFDTLFERPAWVATTLWSMLPQLFVPGAKTIPYNLPDYVIRERLPKDAWTMLFTMKFACPLLSEETGEAVAFVSTGRYTPIGRGTEAKTLDIL